MGEGVRWVKEGGWRWAWGEVSEGGGGEDDDDDGGSGRAHCHKGGKVGTSGAAAGSSFFPFSPEG